MADPSLNSDKFLGVDPGILRAIGCVTVAAARLESTIHSVAIDLLISPQKLQPSPLLKAIKRAAVDHLPKHSRLASGVDLANWTQKANDALNQRHAAAHSAALCLGENPVLVHIRSGDMQLIKIDDLMAIANHIAEVDSEGMAFNCSLRFNPRLGVYLPNAISGGRWIPTCSASEDGISIITPTQDELKEWQKIYGPIPVI